MAPTYLVEVIETIRKVYAITADSRREALIAIEKMGEENLKVYRSGKSASSHEKKYMVIQEIGG